MTAQKEKIALLYYPSTFGDFCYCVTVGRRAALEAPAKRCAADVRDVHDLNEFAVFIWYTRGQKLDWDKILYLMGAVATQTSGPVQVRLPVQRVVKGPRVLCNGVEHAPPLARPKVDGQVGLERIEHMPCTISRKSMP